MQQSAALKPLSALHHSLHDSMTATAAHVLPCALWTSKFGASRCLVLAFLPSVYVKPQFPEPLQLVDQRPAADAQRLRRFRAVETMFAQRLKGQPANFRDSLERGTLHLRAVAGLVCSILVASIHVVHCARDRLAPFPKAVAKAARSSFRCSIERSGFARRAGLRYPARSA